MIKAVIMLISGFVFSIELFSQGSIFKNSKKDVCKDSKQPFGKRIANLLAQMALNEKGFNGLRFRF